MNEEFAIQLKTILDNSSVQRVKEQLDSITKQYSKQNKVVIDVTSNVKQKTNPLRDFLDKLKGGSKGVDFSQDIEQTNEYSARLQLLKDRMNELTEAIMWAQRVSGGLNLKPEEFNRFNDFNSRFNLDNPLKLQAELEEITEKYNKIIAKQNQVDEGTKKITKSHSSWLRSLRNLLLGVIGISSAYSAIRKAMSAYLAQNDELQQKLNACWYALGSLLAPVLEWIVNLFVKIVSYVDVLVKALGFAGINMSKYGKATGKAAKEQKQLASFDEINNLSKQDDSGGAGASNPLENVKLNPKVVNALKKIADFLNRIKEYAWIIAAGIAAWKIGSVLADLLKITDKFSFIAGLGLLTVGIALEVKGIKSIIEDGIDLKNFLETVIGGGAGIAGGGLLGKALGSLLGISGGAAMGAAGAGVVISIPMIFAGIWSSIQEGISWLSAMLTEIGTTSLGASIGAIIGALGGPIGAGVGSLIGLAVGAVINGVIAIIQHAGDIKEWWLSKAWPWLKGIGTSIKDFFLGIDQSLKDWRSNTLIPFFQRLRDGAVARITEIRNGFVNKFNTMKSDVSSFFTSIGNTVSTKFRNIINSYIISPLNKVIGWFNSKLKFTSNGLVIGGVKIFDGFEINLGQLKTLPSLDIGTNYVPNDMLAMVHQGEAVIPKKFNSQEYFGNNEETNRLLEQLIEVVDSKEFKTYISQNEIGKTAVKYINNQSRILGESII